MSQKNNIVNFLIHDAHGKPQMVKVLQNPQIKIKSGPLKVFKVPGHSEVTQQTPLYRAVKVTGAKGTSKVLQLPLHTLTQLQKTATETHTENSTEVSVKDENYLDVEVSVPEVVPLPAKYSEVSSSTPTHSQSYISIAPTMPQTSRRRQHEPEEPTPEYTTKRRKQADKVGKGLRHFSMKVCEKVRKKGFTSYNEVADELVAEFAAGVHGSADSQQYDQKNIRRRVYDALNVLMAMKIISKEKKEIRWIGLPTNSIQECNTLEIEKESKLERIQKKTQQLEELLLQIISFKTLIERNKEAESKGHRPSVSSAIHLPFIVVNTDEEALINCSISDDKTEYMFTFDKKFQIHDDIDILKKMGLVFGLDKGDCTEEDIEKAKAMVPKSLEQYVEQMGRGVTTKVTDMLHDDGDTEDDNEDDEEDVSVDPEAEEPTPEDDDDSAESSDVDV